MSTPTEREVRDRGDAAQAMLLYASGLEDCRRALGEAFERMPTASGQQGEVYAWEQARIQLLSRMLEPVAEEARMTADLWTRLHRAGRKSRHADRYLRRLDEAEEVGDRGSRP